MQVLNIQVDRARLKKAGHKVRQVREAMTAALAEMGKAWHADMLPLHFEEAAYDRYNYTARKMQRGDRDSKAFRRSYSGRKLRQFKHQRPLVFTGRTLLESKLLQMRFPSKSEAKVLLPRGLNRKHPNSRINMRAEVTRVIPSEARQLRDIAAKTTSAVLKKA